MLSGFWLCGPVFGAGFGFLFAGALKFRFLWCEVSSCGFPSSCTEFGKFGLGFGLKALGLVEEGPNLENGPVSSWLLRGNAKIHTLI